MRDTVAFTLMPDQPRDIRAIYVSDMARATDMGRTWRDELDRRAQGVFRDRKPQAGRNFAAANGGKVVTFAEIPSGYVLGSDSAAGDQTGHESPSVRVN